MPFLRLLGSPCAEVNGVQVDLTPGKPTLLLLFLALRQEWVTRDELAERLFPDTEQTQARANLRVSLLRAAQLPWAQGITSERARVCFQVKTDVERFRAAIVQDKFDEALALYQPLLAGFPLENVPDLATFFEEERRHLQEQYGRVLTIQADRLRSQGQLRQALELLERSLEAEPLGEVALQTALTLCVHLKDREHGLKLYTQFCKVLQAEAGVEPLPSTQALVKELSMVETAGPQLPFPEALRSAELFIGRGSEVARLQRGLPGQVIVSGSAGMGKTALLRRALPDIPILACQEGLTHVPYHALVTFLRQQPIPALGPYDEDLARLLPDLFPQLQPGTFDPHTGKLRLLEALTRAVNQGQPALIIDDVQWADAATLEWLSYLCERPGVPLVIAYRTEERHAELLRLLTQLEQRAITIKLGPLGAEVLAQWLGQLTGQGGNPIRFASWLERHSGGNPLYVLETLRSLFETGLLCEDSAGWHTQIDDLTRDYEELPPPPRLQALIRQRTERLSLQARQLLAALSLYPQASLEFLVELLKLPALDVLNALEEAEIAAFLKEGRFAHDLLRQSVALNLPDLRRKHLHLQIAELLEGQTAESSMLAWHWQQGGQPQRAWPARFQHAEQLVQRGQYEAAIQEWQSLLGELPPGHVLELPVRIRLGRNLFWQDMQEGGRHLQTALDLIEWGQYRSAEQFKVEALLHLAEIRVYQGQGQQAEQLLDEAVILARDVPDLSEGLRRALIEQRVEVGFRRGHYARMRELIKAQPSSWPMLETLMAIGEYFAGNFQYCAEKMQYLLQKYPHLRHQNAMEADIGLCYLTMGQLEAARQVLEAGIGRNDQSQHMQILMLTHLGTLLAGTGETALAEATLLRAQDMAQQLGSLTYLADILHRRSAIPLVVGHLPQALELTRQAYEHIVQVGDPYRMLYITSTYAAILAISGQTEQAAELLQACQPRSDTPPQSLNYYHLGCAHLRWASGESEKGDWHAQQAERLCQQYGMMRLMMLGQVPPVSSETNFSA